jgi:hypothetical protein
MAFELVSRHPRVWRCEHFLSEKECEVLRLCLVDHGTSPPGWIVAQDPETDTESHSLPRFLSFSPAHGGVGELTEEEQRVVEKVERCVAEVTGVAVHQDECRPVLTFRRGEVAEGEETNRRGGVAEGEEKHDVRRHHMRIGLHVDTNNGCYHRFATVLVYLNTLSENKGGCTVFPCASPLLESPARHVEAGSADDVRAGLIDEKHKKRNTREGLGAQSPDHKRRRLCSDPIDPLATAARVLLDAGVTHINTDTVGEEGEDEVGGKEIEDAAQRLLVAATEGQGLVCAPTLGSAVVWFHCDSGGAIDPMTWHGGAACHAKGGGKWTMQAFKSMPIGVRDDDLARAAYAAERVPGVESTVIHFTK